MQGTQCEASKTSEVRARNASLGTNKYTRSKHEEEEEEASRSVNDGVQTRNTIRGDQARCERSR